MNRPNAPKSYIPVAHLAAFALLIGCGSAEPRPTEEPPPPGATSEVHAAEHGAHHGHHGGAGAGHARRHHAHHGGMPHRFEDAGRWSKVFDNPERDTWQQPDKVVAALVDRDDLVIADIGAGTGYFAVRLARAVPRGRVVGVDVEPTMVEHLDKRAAAEGLSNLTGLLAPTDDAELGAIGAPVDLVFVCNTYHHIGQRTAYFEAVKAHLAPGGRVAIVDFRVDSERGPPRRHKLAPDVVEAELVAAGYTLADSHDFLSDQYVRVYSVAPAAE